ncbi:hypothetical protein VTN02DRAFT_2214 [Thermoascus thermophilus]
MSARARRGTGRARCWTRSGCSASGGGRRGGIRSWGNCEPSWTDRRRSRRGSRRRIQPSAGCQRRASCRRSSGRVRWSGPRCSRAAGPGVRTGVRAAAAGPRRGCGFPPFQNNLEEISTDEVNAWSSGGPVESEEGGSDREAQAVRDGGCRAIEMIRSCRRKTVEELRPAEGGGSVGRWRECRSREKEQQPCQLHGEAARCFWR